MLIAEELAPSALEVLADDYEVRHIDGTDRSALLKSLADASAILVRSATQVNAEVVAAAPSSTSSPGPGSASTTSTSPPRPQGRHGRQRPDVQHRLAAEQAIAC